MAASASKPSTEMSHTTFSYAQAAKGQTVAQAASQPSSSSAPPSTSSHGKDDGTTSSASVKAPSVASSDVESRESGDSTLQKQDTEITVARQLAISSDPMAEPSASSLRNGDAASVESSDNAGDEKGPRSASRTSRSTDGDARKARKGKKSRNGDKEADTDNAQEGKEKELPKPVVLSEAPIPTVNFWHKRLEAQAAAKAKVAPTSTTPAAATVVPPAPINGPVDNPKRRSTADDIDIPAGTQTSANGDKVRRKSTDLSRVADQVPRRSGARGSRVPEKDEKTATGSLPSVADATLWPDVRAAAAVDEGKRKPQEKSDRAEKESQEESGPTKRQKEKWVAMPYVPTVNFQTPMPQRNSKPRGGARGGRESGTTRGGHSSGATAATSATAASVLAATPATEKIPAAVSPTTGKESRPRESSGPSRADPLPTATSKRASIDVTNGRKPSASVATERPRDMYVENQPSTTGKGENPRAGRPDLSQTNTEQQPYSARTNFTERRGDLGLKGHDGFKDGGIPTPKEVGYAARDREGRPERGGRGGFRNRGAHNGSVGGHVQQTGFPPNVQYANHLPPGRQNGPYSPPAHQGAFGNGYGSGPVRGGGRGNGRGNSGSAGYGRANSNGASSVPKMPPPLNTANVAYDYQMPPFSTFTSMHPAHLYDASTLQLLMLQVEYYLSVDNLCKDFFIRKRMDSKGFVPLTLIAGFNRLRDLAPDMECIRVACENSDKLDYIVDDQGVERLRLREKWDRFVLHMEEREKEAQNDGPPLWQIRSRHSRPAYTAPVMMTSYPATSPTMFSGPFPVEDQMYQPPYMNGVDMNGHRYAAESQLSAAVPEFSPSVPSPFTLEGMTTFSDERVANLVVTLATDRKAGSNTAGEPVGSASVVNGAPGPVGQTLTNGAMADVKSPSSDFVQSPTVAVSNVVWAENRKPADPSSQETAEDYVTYRKKGLESRQIARPGETPKNMRNLYDFWSDFLVKSFNAKLYNEFRTFALEDASKDPPSRYGLKCLLRYYNELLFGAGEKFWGDERPAPEIFKLHFQSALMLSPHHGLNGNVRI